MSNNFAIHRSLLVKKSKRAHAAKQNGRRSRKQPKKTLKHLVQSDYTEAFEVAGRQEGKGLVLRRKVKPPFSRLAASLAGEASSSKKKNFGSQEGGLPKFLDHETQEACSADLLK
ncbi:hypothetical protein MRX96_021495 [Rhipicephalus microplus]